MKLSISQRRLICLARNILCNNKIVIIDETFDGKPDESVDNIIKESFKNCTVITIGHRLNALIDSDR